MDALRTAIAAVVSGDLSSLVLVMEAKHQDLFDAAGALQGLCVLRPALVRVLEDWRQGRYAVDQVQQWASFVRRGYVAGKGSGSIRPIVIGYEKPHETLIAEIIGRLDEIGDKVDGAVDSFEQEEMMRSLTEGHLE